MQSGRQRGRPRRPCSGGMASSSGNAWVESWQFAPVSSIANGMPRPSQIKWRLLPRLARSVGFAPVCGSQKLLALNNYQLPHGTSRSGHHEKANSATRSESGPKFRRAGNRVNAANKSCQNRNPIVSAASPRECHFEVQTECLLGKLGRIHVVGHLAATALKLGEAAGLNSIVHREQAQRP